MRRQAKYPPDTEDLAKLAEFFGSVDTTQLEGLEEMPDAPDRQLVNVSLRLPRGDLQVLKRVAAQEGLAPSTFMRWVLRRFVRSVTANER